MDLVGLDDFAPVVVAAVTTDRVRSLLLVALRALDELRTLYRQMGATLADPAHFSRAFHAKHGTHPTAWRRKVA